MTCIEMAQKLNLDIVNIGQGELREVTAVYCCDLLSIVMGRAPENGAWVTVMGNINSIAVAQLSDVSCIVLSEGMMLDNEAKEKSILQEICVLKTELDTFSIAKKIDSLL